MKHTLTSLSLLLITLTTHAQVFYGAGVGWVKQQPLLFSNLGYAHGKLITELNLHIMIDGTVAPSLLGGIRLPVAERSGIHLMIGAMNSLDYNIKPVTLKPGRKYYPTGLARFWWRNYQVQMQYADGNAFVTIGVVGF